ncbi:NADH dehydrogenase (ubiquinone) complex I, assembly factor 6-like [Biomphalaria glabrata]|uniref:NADH dehydrogenase (ubiquinone) complex I, assembly factor 6 n=1 Tax=Biomphalaria glabrata TaxID=6526 RepID=A0A9W3AZL6_BIOGL|nr:NADH dehydrogenase (ubiquinone) complex I, assembly factor 6-like [Biomphalaria glabrata]
MNLSKQYMPLPKHLSEIMMLFCKHNNLRQPFRLKSTVKCSDISYCVDLVRKSDYENYLGTLLLPKSSQRAAFAIRAFNIELAQVRDTVSERRIGLMRMQFLKDAMDKIYQSEIPNTPVATELAGACGYYKLSKRWFHRMIDARTSLLHSDSFNTVKDVEDYAENVNSSLYYLLLECLGIKNIHSDHAASHLGKAQGIVTVLRASPYHASVRQVQIPMEILTKHKISQEDIIRGKSSQPLKDAVFELASTANLHLTKSRSLMSSLPQGCYLAFLNACVCDHYLKSLQKVDFNIFDGKLQQKNPLLAYQMFIKKLRRQY